MRASGEEPAAAQLFRAIRLSPAGRAYARMRGDRAALALALILAAGLALRLWAFYGVVQWDCFAYADAAYSVSRWQPVFDPDLTGSLYFTQYIRLPLVLPAAALYRVFGAGDVTSTAFPIAASLAAALVAWWVARRVAGQAAGLFAAALVAMSPLLASNSTSFLPDTVQAALLVGTMALLLEVHHGKHSRRQGAWLAFAAGITWMLAFYAKPTAVGLAIPLAGLVVVRRRIQPELLAGVAGAAAVVMAFELLLVNLGAGWFQDLHVLLTEGRGAQSGALGYTDLDWTYRNAMLRDPMLWPYTLAAVAGVTVTLLRRGLRWILGGWYLSLLVTAAGLYFYFEFLMRLPSLYSWWKEPRYILPLELVMMTLTGIGLSDLAGATRGRWRALGPAAAIAAAVALAAGSVLAIEADHDRVRAARADALAVDLGAFFDAHRDGRVFHFSEDLALTLAYRMGLENGSFYQRAATTTGRLRNRFDKDGRSAVKPGDYVVSLPGEDAWARPTVIPAHWELVLDLPGRAKVYHVPQSPAAPATVSPVVPPVRAQQAEIVASGVSRGWAIPQEHVVLALSRAANISSATTLEVATSCDGERSAPRPLLLAAGVRAGAWDIPVDTLPAPRPRDCQFVVRNDVGDWVPVATVHVPVAITLRPEAGLPFDPVDATGGWYRFDRPFLEDGGSAVALAGAPPLRLTLPEALVAGDYYVDLAVYDYGPGENVLEVRLNGAATQVRWGGGEAGVRRVLVPLPGAKTGDTLELAPVTTGQAAVVIDALVVTDVAPAQP